MPSTAPAPPVVAFDIDGVLRIIQDELTDAASIPGAFATQVTYREND